MKEKQISSEQLERAFEDPTVLEGEPGTCFICEDMRVLLFDEDGKFMQACTRSIHGTHKRFSGAERALAQLSACTSKVFDVKCQDCDGEGWVDFVHPDAIRNRVLAIFLGIFRGIKLSGPVEGLTAKQLLGTLETSCVGATSREPANHQQDPVGITDTDRVDPLKNNQD